MTLILDGCYANGESGVKCYKASVSDESETEFPLSYPVEAELSETGAILNVNSRAGFFCTQYGMENDPLCEGADLVDVQFATANEYSNALEKRELAYSNIVSYFNAHRIAVCRLGQLDVPDRGKRVTYGQPPEKLYIYSYSALTSIRAPEPQDIKIYLSRREGIPPNEEVTVHATWDGRSKVEFLEGPMKGVEILLSLEQARPLWNFFPLRCPGDPVI